MKSRFSHPEAAFAKVVRLFCAQTGRHEARRYRLQLVEFQRGGSDQNPKQESRPARYRFRARRGRSTAETGSRSELERRVQEPWELTRDAAYRPWPCGCGSAFSLMRPVPKPALAHGLKSSLPPKNLLLIRLASRAALAQAEPQCSQAFAAPESVAPENALKPFHSGTGKLFSGCASVPWVSRW